MNWDSLIGSSVSPEILDLEVLLFFLSTGKCFTYHSTWEVFWFLDSTKRSVSEWLRQQAPSVWETFKVLLTKGSMVPVVPMPKQYVALEIGNRKASLLGDASLPRG